MIGTDLNDSIIIAQARYINIETKEVGYNGFLFQHGYSGEGRVG
jgi:hypothetical protein